MTIVEVKGGIGNQLFQYAFSRMLSHKGLDVFLDTSIYDSRRESREFLLDKFPNACYKVADPRRSELLRGYSYDDDLIKKLILKLFRRNTLFSENNNMVYENDIPIDDGYYMSGYWQTYKYFDEIGDSIHNELTFSKDVINYAYTEYKDVLDQIMCNCAISVHIRLTDYLLNINSDLGNVCSKDYYIQAVNRIIEQINNPVFVIFSDDINYAKSLYEEVFENCKHCYVIPDKRNDLAELYLMSACAGNVLANSSFSWWGAWLGAHQKKMVIAPKMWKVGLTQSDIQCPEWELL